MVGIWRPGSGWRCHDQKGFSLLELVMVMTIVGIVGVFAGTKWQGDLTLYTKADQMVNDIRRAQALAMTKNGGNYTILRIGSDSYRIQDSLGVPVDPQATVLSGVTIPNFSFTFDTRGDPGPTTRELQLTQEGQSVTIRIIGNTGAVQRL
ncbi:MAG: type II secretion system protein [Magnetococcales bacterium]|nr:type II secretion system protein [Magnetococcales bacterium]